MSSSWKGKKKIKNNNTPSPTLYQVASTKHSREIKISKDLVMRRISPVISPRNVKGCKGSMTVEASLLLPLVLFFFMHLMGVIEMYRLHGKLMVALWECGNNLAVYAAIPEEIEETIPDIAISYLYVQNRIEDFLGKNYLDTSPIVQGRKGLNYLKSSYEDDCIDIGITYQVKPQISIFPFPYTRLVNRYYAKAWTGYENNPKVQYVYVTIYGDVWHSKVDCSHIFITVNETTWRKIKSLRNVHKEKYTECELCKDEEKDVVVYYTDQGNRYHRDAECSSLVRYVRAIIWEESIPYRPCSRCAEKESET